MKFSPYNIKSQEFNKSLRGYNCEEVHAFLEKLADEFDELGTENARLQKEMEVSKAQIDEFKRIEKNLQDTLINAQESSTKTVETARKQTALLMKEAELKANQIVEKAKEDADKIRSSFLQLREEKALLVARIKAIINTQQDVLLFHQNKTASVKSGAENKTELKNNNINVEDIVEKLL